MRVYSSTQRILHQKRWASKPKWCLFLLSRVEQRPNQPLIVQTRAGCKTLQSFEVRLTISLRGNLKLLWTKPCQYIESHPYPKICAVVAYPIDGEQMVLSTSFERVEIFFFQNSHKDFNKFSILSVLKKNLLLHTSH